MGPTKPAFLMAFFLTLLSSPISLAAGAAPPNPCLMIPEIPDGQSAATGCQADPCVT
ncbi:MAG: hypothetical protein ABSH41_08160 [Syntrophobacteraceae bacterium]